MANGEFQGATRALQATLALALQRFQERRFVEAEALYRRVLEQTPDDADALNMLGLVMAEAGNPLQAIKYIERAIQLAPQRAAYHTNRGEIFRRWGLLDEGLSACARAVELDPNSAEARNNLGLALLGKGAFADALPHIRTAIGLRAQMPQAYFNLGRALKGVGQWREAADALAAAVTQAPGYAEAWYELAVVQERLDDSRASIESCERALQCRPAFPEAWVARGDAWTSLGDNEQALHAYRSALDVDSGFAVARYQLSLCLLGRGEYAEGWQQYESRSNPAIPGAVTPPLLPMPMWQGEGLRNRRLLVLTEQGYGDHIQFCRFVPRLAQAGAEIVMGASPEMRALCETLDGVDEVVTQVDEAWRCGADYWTFVGSLPLLLGIGVEGIGVPVPYLHADPRRLTHWQERLAAHAAKLKVGLVWAGRPTHGNDWRRSLPFAQLAALGAQPEVVFVSLQLGERARDADAAPHGMCVVSAGAELKDFADTAALLSVLDLLISVDSAPVHVAGALGRPVWTLLPFMPDWRWRRDTDVSSWYPSVRLYRQERAGDWDGVLRRVAGDLEQLVVAKR
jgi:tetratricopeptide (TPR) repeat protein